VTAGLGTLGGMERTEHTHARAGLRSVDEAAAYLGVSVRFLREQIALGHLSSVRLGRRVLLDVADLNEYIAAHRIDGGAA
jgi:excisionase family DNA binding protein